jgi:hypothetical protein
MVTNSGGHTAHKQGKEYTNTGQFYQHITLHLDLPLPLLFFTLIVIYFANILLLARLLGVLIDLTSPLMLKS